MSSPCVRIARRAPHRQPHRLRVLPVVGEMAGEQRLGERQPTSQASRDGIALGSTE